MYVRMFHLLPKKLKDNNLKKRIEDFKELHNNMKRKGINYR